MPELGSDSFENLCRAIEKTAEQKNILDITYEKIKNDFAACEDFVSADREALRRNFNALIAVLDINLNKLCRHTSYDVSTVFRIRNGTRNPADPHKFAASVAGYVAVKDLTRAGNLIRNNTFDAFNPLIAVALVYLILVILLTKLLGRLERRLSKSDRSKKSKKKL